MEYTKEQMVEMWRWVCSTDWRRTLHLGETFSEALATECLEQAFHIDAVT